MPVLVRPDGTTVNVGNDGIAAEVARGAKPPETVFVEVPTSTGDILTSEIPYEQFQRMSSQQDVAPTLSREDTVRQLRYISDLKDETSTAGSLGRAALEELTFGAYEPSDDQLLADETFHGTARTVGTIGGAVAPMLVPGIGQGALAGRLARTGARVAKAAETIGGARSALRTAASAIELLPGRALAQVGAGVAERFGGRLAGNIAGGIAEETGRATLRAMIDDDVDLSAEALLGSALIGGAGGGVGYGLSRGADVIERFSQKVADKVKGSVSKVNKIDEDDLVRRLNSQRDPTPTQLSKTEQQLGSELQGAVSKDVSMAGANRSMVKDVSQLETTVKAWRSDPFDPTKALSKQELKIIDDGLESAQALRTYGKQSPAIQSRVMASYGQHLQNVDNMANVVRKAGLSPDDLPIRFGPSNVAARQRSLDELQSTGSPVEDAAQRLSLRLTQGVEEIRAPKDLTDSLLSKTPIVGRLAEKAKDHPLGSLFLLSSIVDGGLGIGAGAVAAGAAVVAGAKGIKQLYKEPGRGLGMSVLTAESLSRLGMDDQDPEDFDGVVKRIRATPPEIISQSVARDLTPAADKIGDDAILKASQAAANRWNALQRRVDTIFGKQSAAQRLVVDKATPKQRRQLTKAISIASDPNAFARLWAKDKLDRDDLKFAEQIWPKHVMEAKSQAINWLDKNGTKTIPRSIRRRLELLLGSDAVEARKDMSALAAQSIIATANARRAQAKQNPPAGSSGIDGRTVARESMSPSQAISSRPSD